MSLEKFWLLCWKNFTLQKRHPIAAIFEILFPVLIVLIFVYARDNLDSETHQELLFTRFQPTGYTNCRTDTGEQYDTIGISPGSNKAIVDLVKSSVGRSGIRIELFSTAKDLHDFLNRDNTTVAGIEFDDNLGVSVSC